MIIIAEYKQIHGFRNRKDKDHRFFSLKNLPLYRSPPGSPNYTKSIAVLSMKNTPSIAGTECLQIPSSDGFDIESEFYNLR